MGHDKAQHLDMQIFQLPQSRRQVLPVAVVLAYHDDHALDELGDHQTVGHGIYRRQVEDDEVKILGQGADHGAHAIGAQQLRRVGRHVAGGDDLQVFQQAHILDNVPLPAQTRQQIGQTRGRVDGQTAGQIGPPHVRLHQQHPLSGFRDGIGQVDGRGAFPFAAGAAGNAHHPAALFVWQGEGQVGPQQLVCLGGSEAQSVAQHGPLLLQGHNIFLGHAFFSEHHCGWPSFPAERLP